MTEIGFHKIGKYFKDVPVVENLTLTVQDREFFTFVGPSGCGKSTILNMVAGLEEVTTGSITFDDTPIAGLPPGERDIAMVFQSYALYPHMTVYENMAFPLRVRKVREREIVEEIRRISDLLELTPLLQRRPRALSGGQRQRVALGRALIRKPRVFLMDEPLSNLDARLRIEMRSELKRLHREFPITTIYVTHDQEEAMALSDRVAVFHERKIQQCGPPLEIYHKPANLFVAGFIGSPPMNLIEARLIQDLPGPPPGLSKIAHRPFVAGIRPTDLIIRREASETALAGKIVQIEPTGTDTWVDLEWRGKKMRGRAAASGEIPGNGTAYFTIPPEKLHFFDPTDGQRLTDL
jgi:ABC-type sugar transport system ATPase subunit